MGTMFEMCNCTGQQVIVPNSKSMVENDINNEYDNNNDNINNNNNGNNHTNSIDEKKNKKKINKDNSIKNNEQNNNNNDSDTYNNISSKGAIMTPKHKKEKTSSRKSKKKEDKNSQKESENKKSRRNSVEKKKKKKKSKNKSDEENFTDNYQSTKKNNVIDIEEDYKEIVISDSILSEIILEEKPKYISSEKKKKIKGRKNINIIILGSNEVGKSSFCIRLVENKYEDFYIPSIGVENYSKNIAYNERSYKLYFTVIWGELSNKKLEEIFLEADFFFLIYDITKIRSFNQINLYLKNLKKYLFLYDKEGKCPNYCLIGNKCDLEGERKVELDVVNKCINKYGMKHFDISVKTAKNINNLIQFCVNIFDKISFSDK